MIQDLLTWCGTVCDLLAGRYPIAFSVIGLIIVALIYLKLRRINQYVEVMHREAEELKKIVRFPYCDECAYKDTCPKRIEALNECTYDYRKQMAAR
jgi:hypothetical protein